MVSNSSMANLLLPEEWIVLETILLHLNWISLLCALFVVVTHLLFKREFPRSMPLQLSSVTCILHSALLIGAIAGYESLSSLPNEPPNPFCYVQAIILQFASMASGCWLLNISIHLYITCVRRWLAQDIRKIIPCIHIFGWIFPLITAIPPIIVNEIALRGTWCWISGNHHGAWEFACFYAPMIIILLVTSVLWFSVVISVCKVSTQFKTMSFTIQNVLIVFILSIGFAVQCAHRIVNVLERDNFLLEAVHTVSLSTIGIFVFLVYGINYDNVQMYIKCFQKFWIKNSYEEVPQKREEILFVN